MKKTLYEQKLQEALREARALRFQYSGRTEILSYGISKATEEKLFDFGGKGYSQYKWFFETMKRVAQKKTEEIIDANLTEYGYVYMKIPQKIINPCICAYVVKINGVITLVLIKEFGIANSLPQQQLDFLMKQTESQRYMYVSLIKDLAYLEVIDHNSNEDDPGRGTNRYPISYFFKILFGDEEANRYIEFSDQLQKGFSEFIGMRPIKTLSSYSLFGFKFVVDKHLREYELVEESVFSKAKNKYVSLSHVDIDHIMHQYQSMYKVMLGKNDYAKSFVTAEWLLDSLAGAKSFDLSSIVMGYCKAVEQLLSRIIQNHADESRMIKGNNTKEEVLLTKEALSQYQVDTTWGAMVVFLSKNLDLFNDKLSDDSVEYILVRLRQMNGKRNKYFHKINCDDWALFQSLKDYAFQLICLLLGSFNFSTDLVLETTDRIQQRNDYIKLCEYINYHANRAFYLRKTMEDELIPVYSVADKDFLCDEDGIPTYSGVYFRSMNTAPSTLLKDYYRLVGPKDEYMFSENNLPAQIYLAETRLVPMPDKMVMSTPNEILWNQGKIYIPSQNEVIDY